MANSFLLTAFLVLLLELVSTTAQGKYSHSPHTGTESTHLRAAPHTQFPAVPHGTWLPAPSLLRLSVSLGATYLQTREMAHCSLIRSGRLACIVKVTGSLARYLPSKVVYEQSAFPGAPLSGTAEVAADREDELTIESLEEHVEYTVRVRASNEEGYGPFSSPVSVTTYQDGLFSINVATPTN